MDISAFIFFSLFYICFWSSIWGAVTYAVAKNRGYTGASNFWLGFFLGLIGLIIVLVRPDKRAELAYYTPVGQLEAYQGRQWYCTRCGSVNLGTNTCVGCGEQYWFCTMCGTANSTQMTHCCRCGYAGMNGQYVNAGGPQMYAPAQQQYLDQPQQTADAYAGYTQYSGPDELLKYKELLDRGAITQEEYEAKKRQILGV